MTVCIRATVVTTLSSRMLPADYSTSSSPAMIASKPIHIRVGQRMASVGSDNVTSNEHSLQHWDTVDMTTASVTDPGRWLYRRTVHRIAHARLRDELASGLCGQWRLGLHCGKRRRIAR